jgi:lysophospholipase L1-like esterase
VVTVAATTPSVAENSLTGTGVFTVSRTGTGAALTIGYAVSGTATAGSDYFSLPGSVTIGANQSSATILVTPKDDGFAEGNETVIVTLSAGTGYTVGSPASATVTIIDDEPPPSSVSLAVTKATTNEGTPADPGIITVSRTGATTAALTVYYTLAGTASNGADYEQLNGSVTIGVGQGSAVINITPREDTFVEGNETVVLTLSADGAYVLGSPISGTVTIVDNDAPAGPSLTSNPSIVVPNGVLTLNWSGIVAPTAKDWIGLYAPGAGDGNYQSWVYVSCSHTALGSAASGACTYSVPATTGTYEFRLFSNDGYTRLATSSPIAVSTVTTNVLIIAPAKGVSAAPNVATTSIARQECNTTFFIPYIQTGNSLVVSAVLGNVPSGAGVKFVLNENLPGQWAQVVMAAPFRTTFAGLVKGEYRVDAYVVDANQNVISGSLYHDSATQIGIGDIYVAIGDSITEGYDGVAYNVTPYTNWLQAPSASIDYRNYPQCGISTGAYHDHWQEASHHIMLNNRLEEFFESPNFILNEGFAGITASGYLARMSDAQWQNRMAALKPNKWLIHLGSNDSGGSATFQNTLQSLINVLKTSYSAAGANIVLAVPQNKTNWQPYINNLIAANGLTAGPDFNTFYLNHPTLIDPNHPTHPNVSGHVEMARLWMFSMISPENVVVQSAGSGQVSVSWGDLKLLEPTVAGYRIYYGTNPASLTNSIDVGSVTVTSFNVGSGTYYFSLQAYDNDLNSPNFSGRSAPVSFP